MEVIQAPENSYAGPLICEASRLTDPYSIVTVQLQAQVGPKVQPVDEFAQHLSMGSGHIDVAGQVQTL
jgi:hypothetical protein